jgi:hypothetical protein
MIVDVRQDEGDGNAGTIPANLSVTRGITAGNLDNGKEDPAAVELLWPGDASLSSDRTKTWQGFPLE